MPTSALPGYIHQRMLWRRSKIAVEGRSHSITDTANRDSVPICNEFHGEYVVVVPCSIDGIRHVIPFTFFGTRHVRAWPQKVLADAGSDHPGRCNKHHRFNEALGFLQLAFMERTFLLRDIKLRTPCTLLQECVKNHAELVASCAECAHHLGSPSCFAS